MNKILVIEDEQAVRSNILKLLTAEGFDAIGAENGRIGVQLAHTHLPNLIICDITMAELDGYGVLKALRQQPETATIPFVFLTAKADRSDFRQGMELGADDYLTKPFTRAELLGAIAVRLQKQQAVTHLKQKIQELQQLNILKDDLLGTVSHDLRAPLANMKMMLQMLDTATNEEQRKQYMDLLQAECTREMKLVDDLLDLQRLESNTVTPSLDILYLPEWLPTVLDPFQPRIRHRRQTLQVNLQPNLPSLRANSEMLERTVGELVNNACKYTSADKVIDITIKQGTQTSSDGETPRLLLIVSNEAEIPASELPNIFKKFYRVPYSDVWRQGGTGLGLCLVQKLVEQLQGTLEVSSHSGWTRFQVELPIHPLACYSNVKDLSDR